uniref:Activin types I and II receptor domain-containing protein n=1 Tax=Setaria digitata TaxID=48799 RepID=A0A915Q0R1_9BILA
MTLPFWQPAMQLWMFTACLLPLSSAVKCLDCVGKDCMGTFCEGDFCVLGLYAPRWGTVEWGEPRTVKGCLSGRMLEKNIRSHCETAEEDGQEPFTCFCDKDYCNNDKAIRRLETSPVPLVTCICRGAHCESKTCIGEMCSYVINHRTKKSEQGCVNASVPLIERRSAGSCMIPPITGAMHHTVSKDPHELLATESCVCMSDYCNSEKPEVTQPEKMKCQTFVTLEAMGTKVFSRNTTCTGEFCFKASIKSKLGHMSEYKTMGCASFLDGAELAEELQPTGCARFESEKVEVESCFQTNDRRAIGRARANQESVLPRRKGKETKYRKTIKKPPEIEVDYEDEDEQHEERKEEKEEEEKESWRKQKATSQNHKEGREKQDKNGKEDGNEEKEMEEVEEKNKIGGKKEKEKNKGNEEEEEEEQEGEDSEHKERETENNEEETTTTRFIFEKPTEPPIPDDSNITLITVFILLMVLIVMSGAVWKFQLHKRLFRANYDTVAGG